LMPRNGILSAGISLKSLPVLGFRRFPSGLTPSALNPELIRRETLRLHNHCVKLNPCEGGEGNSNPLKYLYRKRLFCCGKFYTSEGSIRPSI
jgi:hypothetical protein